ncbi:glycosyl hydrolase family 18 protein [Anaeromicropila populeti]|uniref:Glycosyl hydrolases family 18 n=1 Tax=Anaeromicropila populeti TaxID=37658 RepID=A0A1I6I8M8_9FIRM|nr:glycosyl hydrolase family 18 protein [Anaeromicropila populeti]SFR62750.1 Glycosyl hydrolases family 18 [Anaeromicropila populeti]
MRKNRKPLVLGSCFAITLILIVAGIFLVKKLIPSKEVMDLNEYYPVEKDSILVVLQDEVYEKQGLYLDGVPFIDYETVVDKFNKRFYWDEHENLLIYTTSSEVIKTEVGSEDYYENKSKASLTHQIVKTIGEQVYIALDYVRMFSNIEYEVFEEPARVVINYKWGEEFLYTQVKKKTQLRTEATIKSPILKQLGVGDVLTYVENDSLVKEGFSKVITKDGIMGYVKNKYVKAAYYETPVSDYHEVEYSHISKDYKVNLVWHQVTNQEANNNLLNAISSTKGVTTISPTWFSISSNEGEIVSIASEMYVERAHNEDIEVWALCDDFNKEVDMKELLSYTSRREKLINELISYAIKYNLDGLNIDFERITENSAIDYIQFLRELSIKCRNNGIILSVDTYVPAPYTQFYDREEQGKIVDYVIIMGYDEHHASSEECGSVSSISFVESAIENTLAEVPKERIIMGIPFYTRLWTEGEDGMITSEACGMEQGLAYLEVNGVEPVWQSETGQYYGEYEAEDGQKRIWLEEDKSIELKMKAIQNSDVAGVAAWKLGLEKDSVWNVIIKYVN